MKPKYRTISRILPAAVTIALSMPAATQAAIFVDDTAGNAQPTTADIVASTIRANGGTSANPFVNILNGVSMTGDTAVPETEVLEITAANYTVTVDGTSKLTGTNHHGINSTQAFTLNNSGIISGGTTAGWRGVNTTIATITNNSGATISGTDDGINFSANGGSVTNSGTISGVSGSTSDGIRGRDNLVVTNKTGGSITGIQYGVSANSNLSLTNEVGATISAANEDAVFINSGFSGGTVTNHGTITATGSTSSSDGVRGRNGLTVNNNTNFNLSSVAISGGTITGAQYGINADNNLVLTNQNLATITGTGSGVRAGDSASIDNKAGGTITGTNDAGLRLGDLASVTNAGIILGGEYGVNLGTTTTASVTNNLGGSITGTNQVGVLGSAGVETVTNAGTITGGSNALQLNGGANIVNLNDGSVLNGSARASGGSLYVTMNGGLTSTSDSTQNIINGGVFDATNLDKTGSGLAVVTGTTSASAISVTGGFLYLRNNVTASTIGANAAGIGGLGSWSGDISVTNGGSISPGANPLALTNTVASSIGTLSLSGNVTLDSTSDYVWNVTPGGASDLIILTGSTNTFTTNNSDFVISPTNVNKPLLNGSTLVVDTNEPLIGVFDSISVAPFPSTTPDTGLFYANQNDPIIAEYFSTLSKINGNEDWQLTINHDYSRFGSNPNEVAAGNMLDGMVNSATGDLADLLAAMDYSDASVTEGVLAALDPGAYMATAAGLATNNYHLHRTVETHNAAVRAGDAGCSGCSNVWGSFSYDWQDLNTSNNDFDQDGEVMAFTAGIDFTVAENFRLGLVAEGSQTDLDGDLYLGSEVDSYRFAAYANWGAATGWFVDALIGYNTHSVDQSRGTFMARAAVESASYDADGWQGLINAGYAFQTSCGTISPCVGLEWQQLSVDSFNTSDGPLPISVSGYDIDSFRALAGVRWEADLTESIKGYASATYAFEFEDGAPNTTVGFQGGSYTAAGMELGDSLLLSAGIRWGVATCATIDIGYRGEFAMDDGIDSNGANIGLNYSF